MYSSRFTFFVGHLVSKNDQMLTSEDFNQAAKRLVPSVSIKDLLSYQELERKIKNSWVKIVHYLHIVIHFIVMLLKNLEISL